MTDLEGRALDEALARAMGWDGEGRNHLARYHTSLDALLRDIEPVCRERGMEYWMVGVEDYGKPEGVYYAHAEPNYDEVDYFGPTAATALARAFLAVLTRGEM